jgi:hypothetical protein
MMAAVELEAAIFGTRTDTRTAELEGGPTRS